MLAGLLRLRRRECEEILCRSWGEDASVRQLAQTLARELDMRPAAEKFWWAKNAPAIVFSFQ